jgi:hypothetical protein
VNPAELHGRSLALIVWGKTEFGEDDVVVWQGELSWDGSALWFLYEGVGTDDAVNLQIRPAWYTRIRRALEREIRRIVLDAEFFLLLTIENLAAGAERSLLQRTGLKWPTAAEPEDE